MRPIVLAALILFPFSAQSKDFNGEDWGEWEPWLSAAYIRGIVDGERRMREHTAPSPTGGYECVNEHYSLDSTMRFLKDAYNDARNTHIPIIELLCLSLGARASEVSIQSEISRLRDEYARPQNDS